MPAGLVSAVPTFITPQRCLARQSPRAGRTPPRSSAEGPLRGAALRLQLLGGGQPPPHRVPWPRTGLGQLRAMLGGNLCLWEQQLL